MDRFKPALRKVARELDLPRNVRAAILVEMAADLEALFGHHRRRGASEEEAARRAEQTVLGSSDVIRRLGRLHQATWRGWSESVGARLSGGADLVLMAVGVAPMLLLAGFVAARVLVAHPATPVLWVLIAVGLILVGLVLTAVASLLRGGRAQSRWFPMLLVLSALAPALGVLALALGGHATMSALAIGTPDAATQVSLAARVARDGAALLVGLLLGIAGALSWFVLQNRFSVQLVRDVDAMLEDGPARDTVGGANGIVPLVRGRSA